MTKSGNKEPVQDDDTEIIIDLPPSALEDISQHAAFMFNEWNSVSATETLSAAAIGRADRFPCTNKASHSSQPHLQLVIPDK